MRKLVIAALLTSGPAFAQSIPTAAGPRVRYDNDPNRTVCQRIARIGSRLDSQLLCATQAEWDTDRREARQWVNRMQSFRVNNGR
jgi:hypothetical protein